MKVHFLFLQKSVSTDKRCFNLGLKSNLPVYRYKQNRISAKSSALLFFMQLEFQKYAISTASNNTLIFKCQLLSGTFLWLLVLITLYSVVATS